MTNSKILKSNPILKPMNSALIDLPSPSSISILWNFGSLLGLTLVFQIITGILLSFHYSPHSLSAFLSLVSMIHNYPYMWIINFLHSNGASLFFIFIYLHITRNIYYCTFKNMHTWASGVLILLALSATAFMGYILPWGQMSFWGTTVITNLLSPIPYIGPNLVTWLWGGFSIDFPTLKRFFSLHFLLPFVMLLLVLIHLIYLHQKGSSNPSGLPNDIDKVQFHPYFTMKDSFTLLVTALIFSILVVYKPLIFNDPENFIPANSMTTPIHIQPEWYFLFAYAILRSIPSKLGGVIALLLAIMILLTPLMFFLPMKYSLKFYPTKKYIFMLFINSFLILTWLGANPVEDPYVQMGQAFSILYFSSFIILLL